MVVGTLFLSYPPPVGEWPLPFYLESQSRCRCDSMSRRCSLSGFIIGAIEFAVKGISPVLWKRVQLWNPFEGGLTGFTESGKRYRVNLMKVLIRLRLKAKAASEPRRGWLRCSSYCRLFMAWFQLEWKWLWGEAFFLCCGMARGICGSALLLSFIHQVLESALPQRIDALYILFSWDQEWP